MTVPATVPEIADDETLARAVVSSTEAKSSRGGDVPASAFVYHGHFKISVDRVSKMTSIEAVRHGEIIASERGPNRSFYGWATLTRQKISEARCGCRASPEVGNLWHADILMAEAAAGDDRLHDDLAAALARRSCWRDRSDA